MGTSCKQAMVLVKLSSGVEATFNYTYFFPLQILKVYSGNSELIEVEIVSLR